MHTASDLRRFEIAGVATIEEGAGGMLRLRVTSALAEAHIYLHGAHVAHYQAAGEPPLLFMSSESSFAAGKPIRGGVPVIFPWFGPHPEQPDFPAHGFARTKQWQLISVEQNAAGEVRARFRLEADAETRALWPHDFALEYEVKIGSRLEMSLTVENRSGTAFPYEEALHTYCIVSDVRQVQITGLEGAIYIDKTDHLRRKEQPPEPIRITAETDRIYLKTASKCTADDPSMRRRIIVEKSGSATTVVWNPWIAKSAALPDFGNDEWPGMLCIETANAADDAVTLAAGAKHVLTATVRAEAL